MDTGTQYSKGKHGGAKGKKLSSTSHRHVKGNIVSDSESSDDDSIPSLSCIRKSTAIQRQIERGSVNWEDTAGIDRIRRAHAQKHVSVTKQWGKNEKNTKPWFCKYFQNGSCSFAKDHEVNGRMHKHICLFCLGQGRVLGHAEKDCIFSRR